MARKLGDIVATMENLEQEQQLANAEQGVAAQETATDVAEVNAEVDSDVGEIEQTDAAIEEGEVAQDQLSELTEVAQDSLVGEDETPAEGEVAQEGPGLTEGEATMVEITHETIMRNLGIPYTRQTYTSESFATKTSRREATLEAIATLEAAKESIGSKIMSALKAAFDMVIGFIAKIINNRKLMEKHLTNLEAKVKAMSDGKPKEETLSAGAAQLSIDGKADFNTANGVLAHASNNLIIAKKLAESLYRSKGEDVMASVFTDINGTLDQLPKTGEGSGILGGGKSFKISTSDGNESIEVIETSKASETIAAPNKMQMLAILASAKKVLGELKEAEGIRSRLKAFVDSVKLVLTKTATAVGTRIGTDKSRAKMAGADVMVTLARLARKLMSKVITTVFSSSFKSIKAAADYVAAGIKNLGGEAAAEATA